MPEPAPPGHPGLYAKGQAPERRTIEGNGTGPPKGSQARCDLRTAWLSPCRASGKAASKGAQGQIAHLPSGSKQNLQKRGSPGLMDMARERTGRSLETGTPWTRGHRQAAYPGGCPRVRGERGYGTLHSPALLQKRKEGPLSESLHLSDQSGMRITSWIYAHRAVRRAGPCCGSRYGRCRTGA